MRDLTTGKERSAILKFATPMLLGNLFQQSYHIVDTVIVGRLIGDEALAAVGSSWPVIFALISFTIGIATAGTIIISQYYGAGDYNNVRKAIDTILVFVFFASLAIMLIGILFSKQIFEIIKLPVEVLPQAMVYLRTFLYGTVLLFGFNGISAILRGIGDSKTPLYFQVCAVIVNIILDFVFVKFLGLGIRGVALATVIAYGSSLIVAVIYLNRTHKLVKIKFRRISFDIQIFRQCVNIGVPSGFQQTFVSLAMIALYRIVNQFGTDVIAAYAVAGRIENLAMLPAMMFGQALSAFVGQNLGAGKIERVKSGLWSTIKMSTIVSVIITILVIMLRKWLISIFSDSTNIITIGSGYLVIVSSAYLIFSVMFSLNGVMRGAGDTLVPMFITLFSLWIIRIPIASLLSGRFYYWLSGNGIYWQLPGIFTGELGEKGIWWSVPIAWSIGAICSYFYYKSERWEKKVIIK